MPKRSDLKKVMIIGSGPIVIGQACEFDYSGTQACKALREEGFRVILVNSNPATIMTDPEMADATYIEPITVPMLEKIIEAERPDALLPTLGGQTGLNIAIQLAEKGVLERFAVRMIGADREVEAGLPAERGQQRVGAFLFDDACERTDVEWLDIRRVGELGIGHDRRRVRVHEHDPVPLGLQNAAGLRTRVVELARLADDDRAAADDEDRVEVGPLGH